MMVHKAANLGLFLVLLTCVAWSVATPVRIIYEDPSQNEVLSSEHTRPINWESNSWKLMPNRGSSSGRTTGSPIEGADELQELEEDAEFLQYLPTNGQPSVTTIAPSIVAEGTDYDDNNELSEGTETPEISEYDEIEEATTMMSPTDEDQQFLQSHEDENLIQKPVEIPVPTAAFEVSTQAPSTVPTPAVTRTFTRRPSRPIQTTPASQTSDAAEMAELERKMDELIALAHRVFFRGTTTTRNRSPRRHRPWFSPDSSDYEDTILDGRIPPRRLPSPSSWFNSRPFNSNWHGFSQASEPSVFVLVVEEPEDDDIPAVSHEQEGYGDQVQRSILTVLDMDDSDEPEEDTWGQYSRDFWADLSDW